MDHDTFTQNISSVDLTKHYQTALDVQNACNLSGIVHSLSRMMDEIWTEARENGKGTDYVNTHPICRLFAEQIIFLTGGGMGEPDTYQHAHRIATERAATEQQ